MKHLTKIVCAALVALTALPYAASAQNYIIDNIFGKDSVLLVTPTPPEAKVPKALSKSKNLQKKAAAAQVKADSLYLKNGTAVQLAGTDKDSLRLAALLSEEATVLYKGKKYVTLSSNLKLSDDNPEGTRDSLTARLKNKKDFDIHGKDRWLFSRWLVFALLGLCLAGALLVQFRGLRHGLLLVIGLILLDIYLLFVGVDTATWFMNADLCPPLSSIIGIALLLVFFCLVLRIIIAFFKSGEMPAILYAILLCVLGLPLLGLTYLTVFSGAMSLLLKYWWVLGFLVLVFLTPEPTAKDRARWAYERTYAGMEEKRQKEERETAERRRIDHENHRRTDENTKRGQL